MKAVALRAAALLALPLLAACEDGSGPDGSPSDFVVQAYVEVDDSVGMGAADMPVSAVVTVASMFDDLVLTDSTGADGQVTFPDLPAGAYTVTHAFVAGPGGAELQGNASQSVVAPFEGGTVTTRFVYAFEPGSLSGVVFRDDNGSGAFEVGSDSIFRDVAVLLFAGADTLGTPVASDETDEDGLFDLGDLENGGYTLLVRAPANTAVVGANPRPVTVAAGEPAFLAVELLGDPTGAVITIAEARAEPIGDTVKIRGVVTAGQGTFLNQGLYLQDPTGGILVFGIDSAVGYVAGDSLQVIGTRSESREELFISALAVVDLGAGEPPLPRTITVSDLNAGLFQGELVTLSATVDSVRSGLGGLNVHVHDATDDGLVFVDNDTDIPQAEFTVGVVHTITGILGTFDADDDGTIDDLDRQLKPRGPEDVATGS